MSHYYFMLCQRRAMKTCCWCYSHRWYDDMLRRYAAMPPCCHAPCHYY
jgi:hypothetical protein